MKTLIVGDFSFGSLGASYSRVLRMFGNEVLEFDSVKESKKINPFFCNRYINRIIGTLYNKDLNEKLIETVRAFTPELVLIIKGDFILPHFIRLIKTSFQALIFCFNPDNPFNTQRGSSNNLIRKSIPFYDCYFIWGKFLMEPLKLAGAKQVEYLPFAYDPELHHPVSVSDDEKVIYGSDIAFIGTWDKEREEFLNQLCDFDLAIWGAGWRKSPKLKKYWRHKNVFGEEFSKVCNSSKIILNHIRKQNGNAHNMKTFEIPACAGFMLTKRTDEQLELFAENKEIACYEGVDELLKKIKYYLLNDEERKQIALSGSRKVLEYSYEKVIKKILWIYNDLK